ncbi:hypothetical protein [Streptomyces sp. enrichment culture]|uniref:hypothetical protein n=1 Tax=Streptomyces sp. enrichment culture TaxID=1795815 RepID=UPI003F543AEB
MTSRQGQANAAASDGGAAPPRSGEPVPEPAEGDEYREHRTRPLGKPLTLPELFAFDLDTADFL